MFGLFLKVTDSIITLQSLKAESMQVRRNIQGLKIHDVNFTS